MRRRPWPIVILAVLQIFIEPLTNVFLNSWLSGINPMAYLYWFMHQQDYLSLFYVLGFPPLLGSAIYAMKKWSYPVFVCGSTWMLIQNLLNVQEGLSIPIAAALYLGNLAFVGYFLIPAVKAPYLNPRLRWWETKPRFIVDFPSRCETEGMSGFECRVVDFSEGGVFIETTENLPLGATIQLRFGASARLLSMKATPLFYRPVADRPGGYGCQFTELSSEAHGQIRNLACDLEQSGTPIRGGRLSAWDDFLSWGATLLKTGRGLLPQTDQARASLRKQVPEKRQVS